MKGTTRKSSSNAQFDNLKKNKEISNTTQKRKSYYIKKGGRGGQRPGAGKPKGSKSESTLIKEEVNDIFRKFGIEEDLLKIVDPTKPEGYRTEKKIRSIAVLEMLYKKAIKERDVAAGNAFLDRVAGKARQPVDMSGEIAVEEQYNPEYDEPMQEAMEAYYQALKKMVVKQAKKNK